MSIDDFRKNEDWELWYQDQFDWDCPRKIEVKGKDLVNGLRLLWQYHLHESITPEGQPGFSKFNLRLPLLKRSVEISAESSSLVNIRDWVLGLGENVPDPLGRDYGLLDLIGQAHYDLLIRGKNIDEIMRIAEASENRLDFSLKLNEFIGTLIEEEEIINRNE